MKINYNFNLGAIELQHSGVRPILTRRVDNDPTEVEATSNDTTIFNIKDISVSGTVDMELMELKELLTNDQLSVQKVLDFFKNDLHNIIRENGKVIADLKQGALDRELSHRVKTAEVDVKIDKIKASSEK